MLYWSLERELILKKSCQFRVSHFMWVIFFCTFQFSPMVMNCGYSLNSLHCGQSQLSLVSDWVPPKEQDEMLHNPRQTWMGRHCSFTLKRVKWSGLEWSPLRRGVLDMSHQDTAFSTLDLFEGLYLEHGVGKPHCTLKDVAQEGEGAYLFRMWPMQTSPDLSGKNRWTEFKDKSFDSFFF